MIVLQGYLLLCGIIVLVVAPIHAIVSHNNKQKRLKEHIAKHIRK